MGGTTVIGLWVYLIGCVVFTLVAMTIFMANSHRKRNGPIDSTEDIVSGCIIIVISAGFWPLIVVAGGLWLIAWQLSGGLAEWLDKRELRVRALKEALAVSERELAEARQVVDQWAGEQT